MGNVPENWVRMVTLTVLQTDIEGTVTVTAVQYL
jgi:hypothetical protein